MNKWTYIVCFTQWYTSPAKYDAKHMFSYLDFRCYFEANGQNNIHFWLIQALKNSMTWYFLNFRSLSSKLELVYAPWYCGVEEQMLIFSSIQSPSYMIIVLIWKTPSACLKFGKTSNSAVENLPQRKLWVWAANDARSHKNLITPNSEFRRACASSETTLRSSRSRIRTSLDPKSVYYEWASD